MRKAVQWLGLVLLGVGVILLLLSVVGIDLAFGIVSGASVIVAGWLLLVPVLYRLDLDEYVAIIILHILVFVGIYLILLDTSMWNAVILYGGISGLLYVYKRADRDEYKSCAGDVLFGVSVVLLIVLTFARITGEEATIGIVGTIVEWMVNKVQDWFPRWDWIRELVVLVNQNVDFEYYVYAVLSMLLFAGDEGGNSGYIETEWAGWVLAVIGILITLAGLGTLVFAGGYSAHAVYLLTRLLIVSAGVVLVYLGGHITGDLGW